MSRVFGPATAGVLAPLWVMIIVVGRPARPARRPGPLDAFRGTNLRYSAGGRGRILALMTGIEVFANLVAVLLRACLCNAVARPSPAS